MRRLLTLMMIMVAACGKKGVPNPKDRFPPALEEMRAVDRNHLRLSFSEELDTLTLVPEDFCITSAGRDSLRIIAVYTYLDPSDLMLTTQTQDTIAYLLIGSVRDPNGNVGAVDESFRGSAVRDSVSPFPIGHTATTRARELFVKFSETMDTAKLGWVVLPSGRRNMRAVWQQGFQRISWPPVVEQDSFSTDTLYYFFLHTARDWAGNDVGRFIFMFTPDSSSPAHRVEGRITLGDTLVTGALVVLRKGVAAVAVGLSEGGRFSIAVKEDTAYGVEVFYTNGYGRTSAGVDTTVALGLVRQAAPGYDDIFK